MSRHYRYHRSAGVLRCGIAAIALIGAVPAAAQQAAPAAPSAAPSDSAVVNLVRLLIEQKIITADKGAALLSQAEAEASRARTTAPAPQVATSDLTPAPAGTVRVPYVPETVRTQIKDELRNEVLAQAKAEGWAAPAAAAPEWVNNLRIFGDLRLRSQTNLYSRNNSNQIIDYDEFNQTAPIDLAAPSVLFPFINSRLNRYNLVQLRARLGVEATVAKHFQLGVQIATGDDPSPISTNALLGGGFRKRDVWLDHAYIKGTLVPGVSAIAGRFENPFRFTDLVFDPDLSFDGVEGEVDVGKLFNSGYTFALRGGAFPLDFGDVDLPSRDIEKRNFRDRYLLSGQVEVGRHFDNGIDVRLAGAYHDFTYLRGHVSRPCDVYSFVNIQCSTDQLKPFSLGKGNTLMFLRSFDVSQQGTLPFTQPQIFGLKFAYRLLDVNGSVSVPVSDRIMATLTGDYVRNLGFDPKNICNEGVEGQPQNNIQLNSTSTAGICAPNSPDRFLGGNEGYSAQLALGSPNLFRLNIRKAERGQWAIIGGYKYLETDAVLDSLTDSDFHLGGTNAKGYFLQGTYAPFNNITLGARWLSANEIVGDPLSIDVLQLDLGIAF